MRKLSSRQYAAILLDLCASTPKQQWNELFDGFLAVLRKRRSLRLLPLVLEQIQRIEDEQRGVVPVKLTTSRMLGSAERSHVRQALETAFSRTVELATRIDPQLIAGAVIEYADHRVDGSLRRQVEQLERRLTQSL